MLHSISYCFSVQHLDWRDTQIRLLLAFFELVVDLVVDLVFFSPVARVVLVIIIIIMTINVVILARSTRSWVAYSLPCLLASRSMAFCF